jgi:hypothetical protein
MAKLTPQQVTDKWAANAQAAGTAMQQGVNSVQTAPGVLAAAQQHKLVANWNASITSGKWAANVSGVSLASWKQAMIDKGIPRFGQGVQSAKPKMQAFMTEWLPFMDNIAQTVRTMPDLTLEQNIARMVAQVRGAATFKRSNR